MKSIRLNKIVKSEEYYKVMENYKENDLFKYIIKKNIKPNSNVLSCGCGRGREVRELNKLNCNITAIDIDEENLNRSKELEPNAKYILDDFSQFSYYIPFDNILCLWNTFNFLNGKQKRDFIKNSYINLAKNGTLILTTQLLKDNPRKILFNIKHGIIYYFNNIDKYFDNNKWNIKKINNNGVTIIIALKK